MWQQVCRFTVDGIPKATPRTKGKAVVMKGKKPFARVYTPDTADNWKMQVMLAIREQLPPQPLLDPIRVEIVFRFTRPKSHHVNSDHRRDLKKAAPKWHTGKPDVDNLGKAVMDVLTQCGVFHDDAQVCLVSAEKRYANRDERPGMAIAVHKWHPLV